MIEELRKKFQEIEKFNQQMIEKIEKLEKKTNWREISSFNDRLNSRLIKFYTFR